MQKPKTDNFPLSPTMYLKGHSQGKLFEMIHAQTCTLAISNIATSG
jgi:hypothetical protein